MYDQINEIIEVFVSFKEKNIFPNFFKWRGQIYKVDKVHLVHTSYEGQNVLYHFSVTDKINYFQLVFNPSSLTWKLESLYNNG